MRAARTGGSQGDGEDGDSSRGAGRARSRGERSIRGYGVEVLERFVREVARVEFGGPVSERNDRLAAARRLAYNDISCDRQTVAAVQAMEAILARHAAGQPNCVVEVDHASGGLVLFAPGKSEGEVLYGGRVN